MAYEREKKSAVHFGPIRAKGAEGTKEAYDYTLRDHYVRVINILNRIASIRRCIKSVLKLKGDLDTELALNIIKNHEEQKRIIKLLLKHLANEDLNEKKILADFKKYNESLQNETKYIEANFHNTDKFKAGAKVINKQECMQIVEKAIKEVDNYKKIFEYIHEYNTNKEAGITV